MIKNLKVVNDAAERGIQLFQDFNESIMKGQIQKIYLLQISLAIIKNNFN